MDAHYLWLGFGSWRRARRQARRVLIGRRASLVLPIFRLGVSPWRSAQRLTSARAAMPAHMCCITAGSTIEVYADAVTTVMSVLACGAGRGASAEWGAASAGHRPWLRGGWRCGDMRARAAHAAGAGCAVMHCVQAWRPGTQAALSFCACQPRCRAAGRHSTIRMLCSLLQACHALSFV